MMPRREATSVTDIWAAITEGDMDETKRLVGNGAAINVKQRQSGTTPLNTAAIYGHVEIAKYLIQQGADVSSANKDGNTALHIASFFCHSDLVQVLLEKGVSVSAKNSRGERLLDLVSAPWSQQLAEIYESVGASIGSAIHVMLFRDCSGK